MSVRIDGRSSSPSVFPYQHGEPGFFDRPVVHANGAMLPGRERDDFVEQPVGALHPTADMIDPRPFVERETTGARERCVERGRVAERAAQGRLPSELRSVRARTYVRHEVQRTGSAGLP